jgi:hypothetical protein
MLVRLQAQAPSMAAVESDFAAVDHQHQLAQWLLNSYASSLFGLLNGLAQIVSIDGRCPLWANSGHPTIHSITSSARASSVVGTERPSSFAVFKLTTNSNFVSTWIGISAGFAP